MSGTRKSDARQKCPECNAVLDPKSCVVYNKINPEDSRSRLLAGLYCKSDCLLDAHNRGWPLSYGKKQ